MLTGYRPISLMNMSSEGSGGFTATETIRTTVSAEENGVLNNNQMEFSWGNGASSGAVRNHGQIIDRDWWLDGLTISAVNKGGGTTRVEMYVNQQPTGFIIELPPFTNNAYLNFNKGDLTGSKGDLVGFRTINAGSASVVVVNAYLHHEIDLQIDNSGGGTGTGTPPNLNPDVDANFGQYITSTFGQTQVDFQVTNNSNSFQDWKVRFENVNWEVLQVLGGAGTFVNLGNGVVEITNAQNQLNPSETRNIAVIATTGEAGQQTPTEDPPMIFSILP